MFRLSHLERQLFTFCELGIGRHWQDFSNILLNVATNVGDDDLLEMLACASERYEGGLTAYGPRDFQLRIAVWPARNHLAVSFEDPELEKARQARRIIEQTRL